MAKKNYHKPAEDPRTIGGGLEEKGREGIVLFAEYTMMVIFFEIGGELNGKCWRG